jgi:hypothetical protein
MAQLIAADCDDSVVDILSLRRANAAATLTIGPSRDIR